MASIVHRLSTIQNYRWVSFALILATLFVPVLMVGLGAKVWAADLAALPIFLALVVLTYHRLRNANLSGWWIVPMVLVLNFGPKWDGPAPLTLHLSHLIHLIPVVLGWLVRAPQSIVGTSAQRDVL